MAHAEQPSFGDKQGNEKPSLQMRLCLGLQLQGGDYVPAQCHFLQQILGGNNISSLVQQACMVCCLFDRSFISAKFCFDRNYNAALRLGR